MSPGDMNVLKKLLAEEIDLYLQYSDILKSEKKSLVHYEVAEVTKLTVKRGELLEKMAKYQEARLTFMQKYSETEGVTLTALVKKMCAPRDAKVILRLVKKLRSVVKKSQKSSSEFNGVLTFTSSVVNGVLSLMYQASQNVVKSYSRKGQMKQEYNPTDARATNVLKKA